MTALMYARKLHWYDVGMVTHFVGCMQSALCVYQFGELASHGAYLDAV